MPANQASANNTQPPRHHDYPRRWVNGNSVLAIT